MKMINIDLSSVKTDGIEEYESSLLLKMIKNKDDVCFFKGKIWYGIGYRCIEDESINHKYLEFVEDLNFPNTSAISLVAKIDGEKVVFTTVEK